MRRLSASVFTSESPSAMAWTLSAIPFFLPCRGGMPCSSSTGGRASRFATSGGGAPLATGYRLWRLRRRGLPIRIRSERHQGFLKIASTPRWRAAERRKNGVGRDGPSSGFTFATLSPLRGLNPSALADPRLTPWATFLRRSAAGMKVPVRKRLTRRRADAERRQG
jgi:hypothetical protein